MHPFHEIPYAPVHPEQQVKKEPLNFVGDAHYYNLSKKTIHPILHGEYVVIFTRFVGPNEKPYIFRPSLHKKFGIFTQEGGPNSPFANKIKEALDSGYIGVGVFHHNGQKLELKLKPVLDDAPNHKKSTSTLELRALPTDVPHTDGEDGLGKILEMGVREEDSSIRFGVKELDREEGNNGRVFAYFGFNFVEMKLSCFNPRTGEPGHQLVIGVKIPRTVDVGSSQIIDRKILLALDIWILEDDVRARDLATYEDNSEQPRK